MDANGEEWRRKGATLSDKTARTEYGLTQEEIIRAIRAGKLQYREQAIHGNPFLRLLRREVEVLVSGKHGDDYLNTQQAKAELARVNRELRALRKQVDALEERKASFHYSFVRAHPALKFRRVVRTPAMQRGAQEADIPRDPLYPAHESSLHGYPDRRALLVARLVGSPMGLEHSG